MIEKKSEMIKVRKQSSFFIKIISSFVIIIFSLMVLIYLFSLFAISENNKKILTKNLTNINKSLMIQTEKYIINKNFDNLDYFIKDFGKKINTRITIISLDGLVIADSEKDPNLMENHRNRPEIQKCLNSNKGISIRYSNTLKTKMLYVAMPMLNNKYIIRTSLFMNDVNNLMNTLRKKILMISFFVLLFSIIFAFLISKNLSKPIENIILAAKQVSKGDFSTKVSFGKNKDINILAESFNNMTEEIQNLFQKIKNEKNSLNCIISSIDEALLVIDLDGKVILSNRKIKNITNKKIQNKQLSEIIQDNNFDKFIKKIKNEKISFSEEWSWNGKYFLCSFGWVYYKNEIVIIFHDITKKNEMVKIKKDFVSNVSHELRTPLTAIKGFVEILQDEETKKEKLHYFQIIDKHINRLTNIIKDLLILSNLEENESIQREKINLTNLAIDQETIFKKQINEKSLKFNIVNDKDMPKFYGDRFRLEQMFINLIENAIKYTDHGTIDIKIKNKNNFTQIIVQDTGIGIEKKHYSRLFERFYVTDKSRSRKSGGTGLGLSIVKHIVLLHNGNIKVESKIGKGSKFIIHLPNV
ncbi:MAG: ATP-binding protein [Candidatus Marinimicrobia bacterium]|nr:ATP-binding protein [Candidatus Neomarinimicrobiota bacterium]